MPKFEDWTEILSRLREPEYVGELNEETELQILEEDVNTALDGCEGDDDVRTYVLEGDFKWCRGGGR